LGGPLGEFFKGHTRAELVQGSLDRRILLFPVATPAALQGHPQLEARGYFKAMEHPELGTTVKYPGAFIKSGDGGDIAGLYRRPPLIGEHNAEVFQGELGLSRTEIESLKRSGVI
jgi:crotonobetainyl-CoA:carnitine CoA-transferase CaiB-like acyl-CoA transferase